MLKLGLVLAAVAFGAAASAQGNPGWTTPVAPFRIADGLYYVGSQDLASYLVVTPAVNILINSSLESSPALAKARQAGESVWIDPAGYRAAVAEREKAFETELRKQGG
jgi:hypothetical protein